MQRMDLCLFFFQFSWKTADPMCLHPAPVHSFTFIHFELVLASSWNLKHIHRSTEDWHQDIILNVHFPACTPYCFRVLLPKDYWTGNINSTRCVANMIWCLWVYCYTLLPVSCPTPYPFKTGFLLALIFVASLPAVVASRIGSLQPVLQQASVSSQHYEWPLSGDCCWYSPWLIRTSSSSSCAGGHLGIM